MSKHTPLSRRQFLKLLALGGASAALVACQPPRASQTAEPGEPGAPTQAPPQDTPEPTAIPGGLVPSETPPAAPPLVMIPDNVFASGAFLLTTFKGGGVSIFHNLEAFLHNAGFHCGLNGWTPYDALEEQNSWNGADQLNFEGRLPGAETWLRQSIRLREGALDFEIRLDGRIEMEKIAWAAFAFYLPFRFFSGEKYLADGKEGVYPQQYGGKTSILGGISNFEIYPGETGRNIRIGCAQGLIGLNDARAWNGTEYQLNLSVPLDSDGLRFSLYPPEVASAPNPPAVRWCQAGYPAQGEKYALLEIDWRDRFGDRTVSLEDEEGAAVASGEFEPKLEEYWKKIALFDFSQVEKEGNYRLSWSGGKSSWFPIGPQVFEHYWQLPLDDFLPYEMCHLAVDLGDGMGVHAACHLDDAVQAQPDMVGPDGYIAYEEDAGPGAGKALPLAVGGWHDAGDYDLNMPAQSFVTHKLALAWEEFAPARDVNGLDLAARQMRIGQPDGRPDLLEQVEWGARWLLAMQQEDGRAYVGVIEPLGVWGQNVLPETITDGKTGTGDEREVYTNLHSEMQLQFCVATAAAGRALKGYEDALAQACLAAARKAWEYFHAQPETYRATVYSGGEGMTGRQQMIIAAAAELYLTDPQPEYLAAIEEFKGYLRVLPLAWPAPTVTNCGGFWYAAPFLARLLPRLAEGELKEAVLAALRRALGVLNARLAKRPFPMDWWDFQEWGNNGSFLGYLFDAYWLGKALPDKLSFRQALPCAYWLFGLHPLNDFCFLFGTGLPEPRYLYSGPLLNRFGEQPASVPGAIVPGINRYDPCHLLAYRDIPGEYRNGEACIYDAAIGLFDLLALEKLGNASLKH